MGGFGWQPDPPDHRDFTVAGEEAAGLLATLPRLDGSDELPDVISWRDYCPEVLDQGPFPTSTAHACVGLIQCFERLASGRTIDPSRMFLHRAAARLVEQDAAEVGSGASTTNINLRTALKSVTRFGLPPERLFPYRGENLAATPDPYCFAYAREYASIVYVRLDARGDSADHALSRVRAFLAAGFPCALGFSISSDVGQDADIAFPTLSDSIRGSHAALVVGYDDTRRIRSERGALLIRNSWGRQWGDEGYGWLPYAYVRRRLAIDIWTLLNRPWLESGEFKLPALRLA